MVLVQFKSYCAGIKTSFVLNGVGWFLWFLSLIVKDIQPFFMTVDPLDAEKTLTR